MLVSSSVWKSSGQMTSLGPFVVVIITLKEYERIITLIIITAADYYISGTAFGRDFVFVAAAT